MYQGPLVKSFLITLENVRWGTDFAPSKKTLPLLEYPLKLKIILINKKTIFLENLDVILNKRS